jgi:tetratricopeptide (TPR) repeat protein
MTTIRGIALFTGLLMVASAMANPDVVATEMPTYLFSPPVLPTLEQDSLYEEFHQAYSRGDYIGAETSMSALLTLALDDSALAPEIEAKLRSNAAVLQAQLLFSSDNSDYAASALRQLAQATELLSTLDAFHPMLNRVLLVTSLIHELQQDYEPALDALRHAQHLVHRQHGVYAGQQIPIVERIANVSHQQGDVLSADREYMFELMIAERTYGTDSPEQVPMLVKAGNHFALRAASQPSIQSLAFGNASPSEYRQMRPMLFRTAFEMYENAIRIGEIAYGPDDLRLVHPLREMAYARILQGTGQRRAEKALERVLDIIVANPGTDIPDHARALVALADIYTITGDKAAAEHYLQAWQLLETDPTYKDLQTTLFNTQRRLYPFSDPANGLLKQPMSVEPGEELYVDLGYSIRENGRTYKVKIVDSNLPNAYKRELQTWYHRARFRPRIEQGALVPVDDLLSHQVYIVIEPRPELSADGDGDAEAEAEAEAEANTEVETNPDVGVTLESETVNEVDPSITLKMSEPLRRDAPQPAQTPVILVR